MKFLFSLFVTLAILLVPIIGIFFLPKLVSSDEAERKEGAACLVAAILGSLAWWFVLTR